MPERKTVEVDEVAFLANQQVLKAIQKILANPKSRPLLLQAQKITDPDLVVPEIDAAEPFKQELAKTNEQLAAVQKTLKDKEEKETTEKAAAKFEEDWNKQRKKLANAGYTDEGIAEIEKLAHERGIPDLEAAAALFDRLHPPPEVVQPTGLNGFNVFNQPPDSEEGKEMKLLLDSRGEDDGVLNRMVKKALSDARGPGLMGLRR